MAVAAEVVAGVLIALLLLVTALTLFVGIMGAVFSEGFERCPRCGHRTLAMKGMAHPHGCPETLSEHALHLVHAAFHHVRLRHH
ncbi:MAG TPA: hypothetical protein VGG09_07355 [Acidimicrobiales bacterium]|jgi:hypothetical protein